MQRFLPPAILGFVIVGLAPFMGKLQKLAKDTLENQRLVQLLTVVFAIGATVVVLATLRAARRAAESEGGSAWRGGQALFWVSAGCSLVAAQIALSSRGSASAAAYERLHFVFYGLLAVLFYRAFAAVVPRLWASLGVAASILGVSLMDEGLQWLVPLRTGEFFDLGLNLYGGVAGLLIAQALPLPRDEVLDAASAIPWKRRTALLVGVALVGCLVFIDRAHLGHRIEAGELGAFQSFFTEEELERANEERAERWATRMPVLPLRKALQVEDYFLTEAGWHVLLRNRARADGELQTVRHETMILERYYGASLEIPDGNGWFRYRLPEVERHALEDVELAESYLSPADNRRIWTVSRGWLVVGFALACVVVAALVRLA